MIRRNFLRSLVRNAAGLYLAPDALEMLLEPRRKLWPGASFGPTNSVLYYFVRSMRHNLAEGTTTLELATSDGIRWPLPRWATLTMEGTSHRIAPGNIVEFL